MSALRPNFECKYCGNQFHQSDAIWERGNMRCHRCKDPNLKEIKYIDTYPEVKPTAGTIPRDPPKEDVKEKSDDESFKHLWWLD